MKWKHKVEFSVSESFVRKRKIKELTIEISS